MNISELGQNIKKYRGQRNWTLSKLKQESSVGYATLHDIENGKSQSLNSSNLEKVASALGVGTNELLGIDVIEYTVDDLDGTLDAILESDDLKLDGILITSDEKEDLKELFTFCKNTLRRRRKSKTNGNNSNL